MIRIFKNKSPEVNQMTSVKF